MEKSYKVFNFSESDKILRVLVSEPKESIYRFYQKYTKKWREPSKVNEKGFLKRLFKKEKVEEKEFSKTYEGVIVVPQYKDKEGNWLYSEDNTVRILTEGDDFVNNGSTFVIKKICSPFLSYADNILLIGDSKDIKIDGGNVWVDLKYSYRIWIEILRSDRGLRDVEEVYFLEKEDLLKFLEGLKDLIKDNDLIVEVDSGKVINRENIAL